MRLLLLLLLVVICLGSAFAQTTPRFSVKGTVVDSGNTALVGATVMLLTPKDSSLVNFGRSTDKGTFELKGNKRMPYLLKISYVGYLPYQKEFTPSDDAVTDLGNIELKPITKELFEVVVRTAKAPLSIRGDTIEYNASSFKVPPGSTVEELLRKLPGVQVDQEGNIKAQGEDVKRVTVDGKTFFGTDPKLATKNLPAEAISKVQVFNDKTEKAKITGVDDGVKEKTVNLELKESHKKGGFGKVTAGVGTDARAQIRGNYNKFNSKEQFSVIGFGNNTNQTGLSWDDYQDFRGSQSFNWSDQGDFGFSNGGYIYFGDDNDSFGVPVNGGGRDNRGFSKNYAGGANYNYDTKKTKLSSNYFYNQTQQTLDAVSSRENFLPNGSLRTDIGSSRITFNGIHRGSLRFEQKLDSTNTLIVIGNGRFNKGDERFNSLEQFRRTASAQSGQSRINNSTNYDAFALQTTAIFSHRFQKKGRNFSLSAAYNRNNTNGDGDQRSENTLVTDGTNPVNPIRTINQLNQTNSLRSEIKASALYTEPISKKVFWETFYNFSFRRDEVDRDVFDRTDPGRVFNDSLSRYYTNNFTYNRLGSSFRYTNKGFNVSLGGAALNFHQEGQFTRDQTSSAAPTTVGRTFFTVVPNASMNYDLKNNRYLRANYSVNIRQPSTRDLQPVVDNSNPRYIQEGNPNLLPQLTHSLNGGYNMFNPATFTNVFINVNYNYNINQIVYNQTVDSLLITRTKPINIDGGQSIGSYVSFGFPLKKTKSNLNIWSNVNVGNNPIYINNVLNRTRTNNYNLGLRLDYTPSEKFTLYTNGNWSVTNTSYSINTLQNQQIYSYNYNADMNVLFPAGIYFNGNFNYRIYQNERFGLDQKVPILNLSVYKVIFKNKRGEVRFTAYDVFKRNLGISQSATQNFVSQERVQTLSRYFMLNFTYNMRGVKATTRRQGGMIIF
ncbi:outer membrane beta-barrel family protein [Nibrella viscosa]|uniref:outer membrane beta-barrel family protein n=1 Tax=Nibrella viscosa TaxID=1084524 RepID=UPI0031F005C5